MSKKELLTQVRRYLKLLSAMKKPPVDYIENVRYFIGVIEASQPDELLALVSDWAHMKPTGSYSLTYIETGKTTQ